MKKLVHQPESEVKSVVRRTREYLRHVKYIVAPRVVWSRGRVIQQGAPL